MDITFHRPLAVLIMGKKKKEVQVFEYDGKRITFDFGDGAEMVNATDIAKAFGKRLQDFTRLKQTKAFIKELETSMNAGKGADSHLSKKKAIRSVRGGLDMSLRGTWYEQRLALKLAAWLSPKFEIWVYGKVRELLLTGQASLNEEKISLDKYRKTLDWVFQKIQDNAMEIHHLSDILKDLERLKDEDE